MNIRYIINHNLFIYLKNIKFYLNIHYARTYRCYDRHIVCTSDRYVKRWQFKCNFSILNFKIEHITHLNTFESPGLRNTIHHCAPTFAKITNWSHEDINNSIISVHIRNHHDSSDPSFHQHSNRGAQPIKSISTMRIPADGVLRVRPFSRPQRKPNC